MLKHVRSGKERRWRLKDINSLSKLIERSSWIKVKVLGALLGMTFIYIGALMSICSALGLEPLWPGIVIIFSFGLLIAAIYGMKVKTKLPGDATIDIEPAVQEDWASLKSGTPEQVSVPSSISMEEIRKKFLENKALGMPKFLTHIDTKTGQLTGVVTEIDLKSGRKRTEVSPRDDTVVHIDRSPYQEALRIKELPVELWKDYLPLIDEKGKPVSIVSRAKLIDTLTKPTSVKVKAPIEIEI
jgi:hypothetical protein